ncbi:MAG: Rne/Rng family ribonuclease [Acidimicrobiia bacterium]|nr:Rne/Rng family ribonuclease [Acidimicrobiia bacterium]
MSDQSAAQTSAVEPTTSKRAAGNGTSIQEPSAPVSRTSAPPAQSPKRTTASAAQTADQAKSRTAVADGDQTAPFRPATTPPPPRPAVGKSGDDAAQRSTVGASTPAVDGGTADSSAGSDPAKRRRRRGGRGRGGKAKSDAASSASAATDPGTDRSLNDAAAAKTGQGAARSRTRSSQAKEKDDSGSDSPTATADQTSQRHQNVGGAAGSRSRGGRSSATSKTRPERARPEQAAADQRDGARSQDGGARSGGQRKSDAGGDRSKKRRRTRGAKEVFDEPRREVRTRNGKAAGRYSMCIHIRDEGTQVAILEGRALVEHTLSRPDTNRNIHGNIYIGRVRNVLPGMEAAFVDIGTDKNAVLYRRDVPFDPSDFEGQAPPIEGLLRNGQQVLVQVTKNPIDAKGARLTGAVSQAGRFVVLLPGQPDTFGLSKRLPQQERRRLRKVLERIKPDDAGLIIRTAAEGASAEELRLDVELLARQWAQIQSDQAQFKAPRLLYEEPDLPLRVIREELSSDFRAVYIDHEPTYRAVHDYVRQVVPELLERVHFYEDDLPLFERYHVEEQLMKALDRKVWLPSGGSLIFESTEALTVIDVNTSKNVGSSNLEETVFQNNLEAAEEIGRQLRLRDIGGIIVIDFIDMEIDANRREVFRHFQEILARDKTRTFATPISDLGLVEMTRKRVAGDLVDAFSHTCERCSGRGFTYDQSLL